jgi:chromosomal replication initiator protein
MVENKQLWDNVLSDIEICVSKANFSTWFKDTKIVKQKDGIIFLAVRNEFVKDWLFNKFHKTILKSLRELSSGIRGLEYIISEETEEDSGVFNNIEKINTINNELPLNDLYINKEDNLNPKYTFDSFIIGSFNDLAHAAALAVTKNPGTSYNPFFIHGGTGLGKTHLMQAMGNYIKENYNKKVHYVTSEKFSIDYISSLQNGNINEFKDKYRKYDVLIMDDAQFLSKKTKTQEELFHVFNSLYEKNKQIILSSDKHPNFIPDLEDRLRSRFSAGMIVDVSLPEYESRFAILKNKANSRNFFPPEEILEYLASSLECNIRELEGILNSLIIQSQLKDKNLIIDEVKNLIKNNTKPKKNISPKEIIKLVSGYYKVKESEIYKKTRKKEIVKPRQIIMFLLREDFDISYPTIGQKLGGRDHTTVIHSCDKIKKDIKNNNVLLQEIEQLRAMF